MIIKQIYFETGSEVPKKRHVIHGFISTVVLFVCGSYYVSVYTDLVGRYGDIHQEDLILFLSF
jgi:uncharacterized BrkB/YihY/UPF0761 family membrane protein